MTKKIDSKDERSTRLKRLEQLRKMGIEPYPSKSERTHTCGEVGLDFEKLSKGKKKVSLVGRLRSLRGHGGSTFANIEDGEGKFQIYFKKDEVGADKYKIVDLLDVGDFVQASGELFLTKKGEKTLMVQNFEILSKSVMPLPEKWHGLSDTEIRYRKRYLDLIANPQVREIFEKRSLILKTLRNFLESKGFLEVETPILQPMAGGALAKPFITHHNTLDIDLYLRIAPELYLKRLVVGGFEKVYEVARCFRNEGIDWQHNPEFTQIEFYWAYASYEDLMELTEEMFSELMKEVNEGDMTIEYDKHKINFAPPYARLTFREGIKKYAKFDIEKYQDVDDLRKKAHELKVDVDKKDGRGKILDEIYKEHVRKRIDKPTFIIDHPIELSPLAKQKEEDPNYVQRLQLIVPGGLEMCNAYTELNDPVEQAVRFKEQEKERKKGDLEAHEFDRDFVEALEHGMPPTAGYGIGIDRLCAVLTNSKNLKEVILFPTLRPKE